MTTPISNNNPASIANNKSSSSAGSGHSAQEQLVNQSERLATRQNQDAVSISRAAEVLNQVSADRSQGVIQSPEQAAALTQQLKNMLHDNPGQALVSQSGNISASIIELLKAG